MDRSKKYMKSTSYGEAVVDSFRGLQHNDELCDFTVTAEGKSIRVHKVVLAAMSDYFRAMLLGGMKEQQENQVDLKGLTADSLQLIIEFLYSGSMQLDHENLIEVLNASSHLQVKTALGLCSDYIISLLTFANSEELLHIAETYSLTTVTDYFTNKVLTNFQQFGDSEQFLGLKAEELSRYMGDDRLVISSEKILYDAVTRWVTHDAERGQHLEQLLRQIRFALIPEHVLMILLQQHFLTANYPVTKKYLSDGRKYHYDCKAGHPQLPISTKVRATSDNLVFIHQGSSYKPFEVTSYDHVQDKFFQLATDISGSRDCRVVSVDNFAYICRVVDCGGGTLMNSLLRFDPRHLCCQELSPSRRLRLDPALAATDTHLYLMGGATDSYMFYDSLECYDIAHNTWMELTSLPAATHSLAAVACSDVIYLSGGLERTSRNPVTCLRSFDTKTHTFESKAPMNCARRLHEMACTNGCVFVLGGISDHTFNQRTLIPIESYHIATNQWTTLLTGTIAGRAVGHFVAFENALLSIGREHRDATEEEIRRYEPDSWKPEWQPYARVPRRSGLSGVTTAKLFINFNDERIEKHVISDKR